MNTNDLQIIAKNLAALNQHMLSSDKMIFYGLFAIAAWLIALTIAVLIVRARQTPLLYASPLIFRIHEKICPMPKPSELPDARRVQRQGEAD